MVTAKELKFIKNKYKEPGLYNTIDIESFDKPMNVIIGPNGTGKSMTCKLAEDYCKKNSIGVYRYTTKSNDVVDGCRSAYLDLSPEKLAAAFTSEGERMNYSFDTWLIENILPNIKNNDKMYIILDEIDSGLSPDRIWSSLQVVKTMCKVENEHKHDVRFIITCNSYELLEFISLNTDLNIFWMPTTDKVVINSYKDFRKLYYNYLKEFQKYDKD
jgi:AAA15 family ATPase/GTPase